MEGTNKNIKKTKYLLDNAVMISLGIHFSSYLVHSSMATK